MPTRTISGFSADVRPSVLLGCPFGKIASRVRAPDVTSRILGSENQRHRVAFHLPDLSDRRHTSGLWRRASSSGRGKGLLFYLGAVKRPLVSRV